jgi:tRNA(fMet)-specific endonuclease VapC
MLQFLYDTDHLTLLEHGHAPLQHRLAQLSAGVVGISAVTVEEALRSRLGYLARRLDSTARVRGYTLLLGTVQLLNQLPQVPFDDRCEMEYQQLRAQRLRIGVQDLKIAAVALVNQLVLLTRNRQDFTHVPGLKVDDWSI